MVLPPLDMARTGSLRTDVARVTQDLAGALGAADPGRARAVAPDAAQLAVRSLGAGDLAPARTPLAAQTRPGPDGAGPIARR